MGRLSLTGQYMELLKSMACDSEESFVVCGTEWEAIKLERNPDKECVLGCCDGGTNKSSRVGRPDLHLALEEGELRDTSSNEVGNR